MLPLSNLVQQWQVHGESGVIGRQTELALLVKARFGQAAKMRACLRVQERLSDAGIALLD